MNKIRIIVICGAAITVTAPAWSIDCSKANQEVEKSICGSPQLLAMDGKLNQAFEQFLRGRSTSGKADFRKAQKSWLSKELSVCANREECIARFLKARISYFSLEPKFGVNPGGPLDRKVFADTDTGQTNDAISFKQAKLPFEKVWNAVAKKILTDDSSPTGEGAWGSAGFEMIYASKGLISGRVSKGWGSETMSHPNWTTRAVNIHVPSGEAMLFADVFKSDALEKLTETCISQTRPESFDNDAVELLKGRILSMDSWVLKPDGAELLLPPYSLGGYTQPSYGCSYKRNELKPLVQPTFELWQ